MKKFLCLVMCLTLLISLSSCFSKNTDDFKALKNDQVLHIGNVSYKNQDTSITNTYILRVEKKVTYTLEKTNSNYYESYEGYAKIGDYTYYFVPTVETKEEALGNITEKISIKYEYMPYSETENIVLKTIKTTQKIYDFADEGFVEKPRTYEINLNGYFDSVDELMTIAPELFSTVDTSETKKYYFEVGKPPITTTQTKKFETYFYID